MAMILKGRGNAFKICLGSLETHDEEEPLQNLDEKQPYTMSVNLEPTVQVSCVFAVDGLSVCL